MATAKEKATDILGFKTVIGIASLVGLIGGLLFGVWDGVSVITHYAPPVALSEVLLFYLYSMALYAVIGGLGMAAVGVVMTGLIYIGRYRIKKSQLAGIFTGVFVLLAVSVLLAENIMSGNAFDVVESTVICILSGVGLGGLSAYALDKGVGKGKLITGRTRQASFILLAIMVSIFIPVSFIGPFSSGNSQGAGTPITSENLEEKPNILWIVMDTVRADHVSGNGYYRNTTPNIDNIASEGILFENCIAEAPWTLPSHASMFTSLFPSKHGTDMEHQWLEDDFQTIAEVLRQHGYETFGYSNNPYVSPETNLSQGFDTFEVTLAGRYEAGSELADELKVSIAKRYVQNYLLMDNGACRTNEVVKGWIAEAHQAETPFFVFINYMEAHIPYYPPEEYALPYLGEGISLAEAMSINQSIEPYIFGQVEMSDEDFEILRALYDGEISYLDFRIGQLFDYLKELQIWDNTVLIITADHGENFGDHQLMNHRLCVYDTLLHVPLIIRYPGLAETGMRVDEPVQLTDLFPTILDIVGIDGNGEEQIQGHSLVEDGQKVGSTFAIAEYVSLLEVDCDRNPQFDVSKYCRRLKTVRSNEFKYIWSSDGRDELYNISHDPGELNNLIETEPEKAEELKAVLQEWLNSFEPYRAETAQQVQ